MPRTSWTPVNLRVLVNRRKSDGVTAAPLLPWPLAAALTGVGAAAASWLVIAGVMMLCWFTILAMPLSDLLTFGTQLWLLSLGVPAAVGSNTLTIVPLGLTFFIIWLNTRLCAMAVRQAALARPEPSTRQGLLLTGAVAGIHITAFVAVTALISLVIGRMDALLPACLGAAIVTAISAAWAGLSGNRLIALADLPNQVQRVIAGALGGLLTLTAISAAAVLLATWLGWDRISELEAALVPDGVGVVVLAVMTLAWLPNLLIWAVSWMLGGGFSVGIGSFVSLSGTQLGMLPAIPIFGALPPIGVAPPELVLWMLSGVGAGAVAARCASGRQANISVVERVLTSAGAALGTAIVIILIAAASRGDLGTLRLINLGPDIPGLLVIAPAVIVLSAALTAVIIWLLPTNRPRQLGDADEVTIAT